MLRKQKNQAAAILGRLSGLSRRGQKGMKLPGVTKKQIQSASAAFSKIGCAKGGRIRAANLSAMARKLIAKKAARARWSSEKNNELNYK